MATLEFVRTYFDDLLCITEGSLKDHLSKLREVFNKLQEAGLKVNADKLKFCAIETEYLGYILTRDGIKLQTNKVQAMQVHVYHYLWAKHSKMLAPLTDLVGECG